MNARHVQTRKAECADVSPSRKRSLGLHISTGLQVTRVGASLKRIHLPSEYDKNGEPGKPRRLFVYVVADSTEGSVVRPLHVFRPKAYTPSPTICAAANRHHQGLTH